MGGVVVVVGVVGVVVVSRPDTVAGNGNTPMSLVDLPLVVVAWVWVVAAVV